MGCRNRGRGEQGDYYDSLFTYKEGDEASYFISDEPEGHVTDVGPSGAGEGKKSPMASSSRELVTEPVESEGEPGVTITVEALKNDELLLEPASGDLAKPGASSATVGVSSMEPVEVSTAVEEARKDIVEEAIGAMSIMTSGHFGNVIVICK